MHIHTTRNIFCQWNDKEPPLYKMSYIVYYVRMIYITKLQILNASERENAIHSRTHIIHTYMYIYTPREIMCFYNETFAARLRDCRKNDKLYCVYCMNTSKLKTLCYYWIDGNSIKWIVYFAIDWIDFHCDYA